MRQRFTSRPVARSKNSSQSCWPTASQRPSGLNAPGTSKWNKIEHRVFCHITRNWRGVPLETLEVVVESIGATTTATGLEVHAWLDEGTYETGRKVSDEELAACQIKPHRYHGDWNYEIHPRV